MDPRLPTGSINRKKCSDDPLQIPGHAQFPRHLSFSQPSYAMSVPHQQFPQQTLYPPNFQYVVVQPQYAPYPVPTPAPPPAGYVSSQPPLNAPVMPSISVSDSGTPCSETAPEEQIANGDNGQSAEPVRTARRLRWTEKEDLRLISAWLNYYKENSKEGNVYWANIAATYNSTTPRCRRREGNQLKSHWKKITKKIVHFDDCWCQVKGKYPSGISDNLQLMDKTWAMLNEEARAAYYKEAKHSFNLDHCWKAVWDQPKWKAYVSLSNKKDNLFESLSFKRNNLIELMDCTSSSEDMEDAPRKEMGKDCMTTTEKIGVKGKMPSSLSEVQEDIQSSVDLQNTLKKYCKETTCMQLQLLDQKLETKQPQTKESETILSEKQTELLMANTPGSIEFQRGRELQVAGTSDYEFHAHGCRILEQERVAREDVTEKDIDQKGCKVLEHQRSVVEDVAEKQKLLQGTNVPKLKRKHKGKESSSSSEVQKDIKRAVDLQTILQKDREKMSEVQLRLSKEKLEYARLKQQEAKDKKETTLCEKYTELLMADTSRFNEFQKIEYERAVKRMGEMLFGDGIDDQ